eukprot:9531009-Ditylum_brightwellii.AAC.1
MNGLIKRGHIQRICPMLQNLPNLRLGGNSVEAPIQVKGGFEIPVSREKKVKKETTKDELRSSTNMLHTANVTVPSSPVSILKSNKPIGTNNGQSSATRKTMRRETSDKQAKSYAAVP